MMTVELLDEIAALFHKGDREDALELLDVYLSENLDDPRARLLKAEMCMALEAHADFVGQALVELKPLIGHTNAYQQLQQQVDDTIRRKMSEGREQLSRQRSAALECFETACKLSPLDAVVPLAAAQSWASQPAESQAERSGSVRTIEMLLRLDLDEDGVDTQQATKPVNSADSLEVISRFLQLAMMRSMPGDPIYTRADRMLARCWLDHGLLQQVADWLQHTPYDQESTEEIRATFISRMTADIGLTLRSLLRAGDLAAAESVIDQWKTHLPSTAAWHIWQAELLRLRAEHTLALAAYESAYQARDEAHELPYQAVLEVWTRTQDINIGCETCSHTNRSNESHCALCGESLRSEELLQDRYLLSDTVEPAVVAHLGLAELLPEARQPERIDHLLAVGNLMKDERRAVMQALQQRINELAKTEIENDPTERFTGALQAREITPEVLGDLIQIDQATWELIPLQTRLAVLKRLQKAGLLFDARQLTAIMFVGRRDLTSVRRGLDELDQSINAFVELRLRDAQTAMKSAQYERAVQLASDVLKLQPKHIGALMLRGDAYLHIGRHADALGSFYRVISNSRRRTITQKAQVKAARIMEHLGQYSAALDLVTELPSDETVDLRKRLERYRQNEPYIHVEPADALVMHDTLSQADGVPHYRGYFAVVVRAVGRPWKASPEAWRDGILSAGYTFVEILGGLRNTPGDPAFALRFISQPHPHIPERGRLQMALIVRVTADDEASCLSTAQRLWRVLRDILPGSQEHVYEFVPVITAQELVRLREPFVAEGVTEIVRREDIPVREGDRYAVYPFTPGGLELRQLCWTLLRQSDPVMVSIQLLPTHLMAWEQSTLNRMMLTNSDTGSTAEPDPAPMADSVAKWWQDATGIGRAQATRHMLDSLRASAYVLSVSVAASQDAPLLPERVASAMFGSARSAQGASSGGYQIVTALNDEELDVARRNLSDVDFERWGFSAAPAGLPRLRHLVSEYEAAVAFRFPVPGGDGLPGVAVADTRPIAPPAGLPADGIRLGDSVIRVNGAALPITQSDDDRRRHTYIVGRTGTGKSNLIKNLALQDMRAGHGVCVIDPHGDLIDDLLTRIPPERARDVILFDPGDEGRPIGLNLLEHRDETEKHLIVNEFLAMLMRMYDRNQIGIVGPRFQHNVRNAMLTAMSAEGSTLIEVVRVLSDRGFVRKLLPGVKDPLVRSYWVDQIDQTSDFHKSEVLDYIVSKFNPFVGDRRVRHIIGQRKTTINFRHVMDERKILLVNLCKGRIGAENARFLGLLLVQRLLMTALSRADMPEDRRPDFMLYVDEFQNFATSTFATILSEGRKYGVAATVANQYLTQLDGPIREAIFGNVGTIINFRLGPQDAATLAPEMYPVFGGDDLINLPKYTACIKLLVGGLAARPFTMRTQLEMSLPDHRLAGSIRKTSRLTYGRDAEAIEREIAARYAD